MTPSLLALLATSAQAAEWGKVFGLSEIDGAGRLVRVDQTAQAVVVRGGAETPLTVGMTLEEGDTVRTASARVAIQRPDRERVWVSDGAELLLVEPRGVLQALGDIYFRVREGFSVEVGAVEGAVEGTQYLVHATGTADAVTVVVAEGVVGVKNPDDQERVKRGFEVTAPQQGDIPNAKRTSMKDQKNWFEHTWLLGRPRLVLGGGPVGGLLRSGVQVGARGFARVQLAPMVRLVGDLGFDNNGGEPGLRLPTGLGLDLGPSLFSATLRVQDDLEVKVCDCAFPQEPGRLTALHVGGTGAVHTSLPFGRRLTVEGELRGGYVGGLRADFWVGVGVGL